MNKQARVVLGVGLAKKEEDGRILILNIRESKKYRTKVLTIEYKGEELDVLTSSKRVPKGTYNQEVKDVPYFVLDNDVYALEDFDKQLGGFM